MLLLPLFCALASFATVFYLTPWLIRYLRRIDLTVKDMNKEDKLLVPISGGLVVMAGVFIGLMLFIFFKTFFPDKSVFVIDTDDLNLLFAATTTIIMISFVGFIDDLIINKNKEASIGLKQWQKPLLTMVAAVPLMVVNAGVTKMGVPFFGTVEFGILYPLLLIPIGVVGAANMVNMLAGYNGLEAGLGIIYFGNLGLYAYFNGRYLAALIALMVFASLLAFYIFNRYPAKILPGDSLTYFMGGALISVAVLGNIERAALIVSIPFFIEFLLKLRKRFRANSYGIYRDGKIYSLYNKVYSIPHIFARTGKFTERQITYFIFLIEIIFCGLIWVI